MKQNSKKQAYIFVGAPATGKSRVANQIWKSYGDNAVWCTALDLKSRNINRIVNCCTEKTKILIVDDLSPKFKIDQLLSIITGPFKVDKRFENPFSVQLEKLIIICDSDVTSDSINISPEFKRRFKIIEFPNAEIDKLLSTGRQFHNDGWKDIDTNKLLSILENCK